MTAARRIIPAGILAAAATLTATPADAQITYDCRKTQEEWCLAIDVADLPANHRIHLGDCFTEWWTTWTFTDVETTSTWLTGTATDPAWNDPHAPLNNPGHPVTVCPPNVGKWHYYVHATDDFSQAESWVNNVIY